MEIEIKVTDAYSRWPEIRRSTIEFVAWYHTNQQRPFKSERLETIRQLLLAGF